jgi:hypothetical protein
MLRKEWNADLPTLTKPATVGPVIVGAASDRDRRSCCSGRCRHGAIGCTCDLVGKSADLCTKDRDS